MNSLPFETKLISNFPSRISFGGYLLKKKGNYSIGAEYNYNSTGCRISSGDYSGKYLFDEILISHSMGILNSISIFSLGRFHAEARVSVGINFSSIRLTEYLQVFDSAMSSSPSFHSSSIYITPGVIISYVFPFMRIGADVGYYLESDGIFTTKTGEKGSNKTNWSGLRAGITLGAFQKELFRKKGKKKDK